MSTRAIGWAWVAAQFAALAVLLLLPWRTPSLVSIVLGAVVAMAGVLLGLATSRALGSAFTPTPVPIRGAGLRMTGVYARVRHPMYGAVLLIVLGLLIAAGSPWGWAWGVALVVFFVLKSRWEDSLLHTAYGSEWEAWANRTGALVPRRMPPRTKPGA